MPRATNREDAAAGVEALAAQVRRRAASGGTKPAVEGSELLLVPTGSTLLNLAVSDRADGGWGAGKTINLVGDSNAGKTLLALTGLMEMSLDPRFARWRLVYDDSENALEMPVEDMFGPRLAERIEDPYGHPFGDEAWQASETIEDVRNNLWRLLDASAEDDRPVFYVLDSYDAVTSREELARQAQEVQGKELKRDYPRGPGILSETLRKTKARLRATQSNLMVISQTRDVMDAVSFAAQKRRAGGRALQFYSSHEAWLAIESRITREVGGKKMVVGFDVVAKSARSKLTGKTRTVPLTTYASYGVDDIGATICWLLDVGHWRGSRQRVDSRGTAPAMSVSDLIEWAEHSPAARLPLLRAAAQEAWNEREAKLAPDRLRRWETEAPDAEGGDAE